MTPPADPNRAPQNELAWRVVGLVNLYRLLVPLVLLGIVLLTKPAPTLGAQHLQVFVVVCVTYWVLGVLLTAAGRRWPTRQLLTLVQTLIDTGAICLLLYASGGASSGLGILLVIPVGAMALLADSRNALMVAAIAALGILLQQIAAVAGGSAPATDYPLAGVMGAVVFLVAMAVRPVSNRLRESEALVHRQEVDLANLAQLSQYVVQHLRESILVIDPGERIRLINESAAGVLGAALALPGALIGEVSPKLMYLLETWRQSGTVIQGANSGTFVAADGARVIRPHFAPLGNSEPAPVIAFLEDTGLIAAKVQQTKLAALGRLSASIAHEIRNPVGAMSHAAQLLAESPGLTAEDRRLTQIVQTNGVRVSEIINHILQLSRREALKPERLALGDWITRFRTEFCATVQTPPERLKIDTADGNVTVRVDAGQLRQIVWNLCQNALTHGGDGDNFRGASTQSPSVEIRYGRLAGGRPYLEVADRGSGIEPGDVERIFEPFFTRSKQGTGLGLFLAREFAQANGANLLYEARDGGGSIFRVVFSDPNRWADLNDLNDLNEHDETHRTHRR